MGDLPLTPVVLQLLLFVLFFLKFLTTEFPEYRLTGELPPVRFSNHLLPDKLLTSPDLRQLAVSQSPLITQMKLLG